MNSKLRGICDYHMSILRLYQFPLRFCFVFGNTVHSDSCKGNRVIGRNTDGLLQKNRALANNFYLRLANSMQDYYKIHADELQYFKKEVRKAFVAICNSFGFKEEKVILTDTDNLFQVTFSSSSMRIVVTGINWGMNVAIDFGLNKKGSNLYSILQLIKERKPEIPVAGNQIDQLFGYADYLSVYAADILWGETTFFNEQEALKKQEKENARKVMEAESVRKLAEGYLKIDSPTGEPIWRKPRPLLSTYHSTKDKFSQCFEVVFNPGDLLDYAQYEEAIISDWKKDLGEIVRIDEVICEISTDKVSVEIVAPHTGRLIWLLEEGIALGSSACIALLDLDGAIYKI